MAGVRSDFHDVDSEYWFPTLYMNAKMSALEEDQGQWELSKENIQPLKQGRKATVLSVALDENAQKKLALERQEYEKELRTYSGDDPLDIWYRYVVWVEQNYPNGGKDGNIKVLIEKCVEAIQSSEKYLNDQRYLEIWIKYASISPVSLAIYKALDSKGIGFGFAAYYESYAWELEKDGSYKRADAIYQLGIQRLAKPLDQLEASHRKFQARVARYPMTNLWPRTPLMLAISEGHEGIVAKLINFAGADVNKEDGYGDAPIHVAARHGRLHIAKMLQANGRFDVTARNGYDGNRTALHYAAYSGHMKMSSWFLNQGISARARDSGGRTAADWARMDGHKDLAAALRHAEVHGPTIPSLQELCKNGIQQQVTKTHLSSLPLPKKIISYLAEPLACFI